MEYTAKAAPELGIVHLYLAKCQLKQKDPEAALESYNTAVSLDKKRKDLDFRINIQEAIWKRLVDAGDYVQAHSLCQEMLDTLKKEHEENAAIRQRRICRVKRMVADTYYKEKKFQTAADLYEDILGEMDKDEGMMSIMLVGDEKKEVHQKLAKIYQELNQPEKAAFHSRKAEELERYQTYFACAMCAGPLALFITFGHFIAAIAASAVFMIIYFSTKDKGNPIQPGTRRIYWTFRDVASVYVKAFGAPLTAFMFIYLVIVLIKGQAGLLLFGSSFVWTALISILGFVLLLVLANKRFQVRFQNEYPDETWNISEQRRSYLILSLWQMLATVVVMITAGVGTVTLILVLTFSQF